MVQSGSDIPELVVPSISGYTHMVNAIDAGSDRLVSIFTVITNFTVHMLYVLNVASVVVLSLYEQYHMIMVP